jgi:hypothetical protein
MVKKYKSLKKEASERNKLDVVFLGDSIGRCPNIHALCGFLLLLFSQVGFWWLVWN